MWHQKTKAASRIRTIDAYAKAPGHACEADDATRLRCTLRQRACSGAVHALCKAPELNRSRCSDERVDLKLLLYPKGRAVARGAAGRIRPWSAPAGGRASGAGRLRGPKS